MIRRKRPYVAGTLATALLGSVFALATPAYAQDATQERLVNADAEPQNWLIPFQNYSSHRYSRLDEVNRDTVGGLRVAFTVSLEDNSRGNVTNDNQSSPLVDNGVMWVEAHSGMLYRLDISSGDAGHIVWKADAGIDPEEHPRTRGFAMFEDSLVQNLTDGRVLRVDRDTGEIVWDLQIARVDGPGHSGVNLQEEGFRSNPLVAEGVIQVGNSRGDAGTRGWVAGLDFETGEELWRFYTVPGPGEFGHETWADEAGVAWRTGGAAIWTGWSYDPVQSAFIGGTAQPVPMFDPEYRPGDNLFSNSALSLDVHTGELNWFFQYTANESWDYDEQGVHMLINAPFGDSDRQMVTHFGRNGYYYQLDRTNGEFLTATQYVESITWTEGIDEKTGQPIEYDPSLTLQTYIPETRWARADADPKSVCPTVLGGTRWQPPSYNPDRMVAFVGSQDGCSGPNLILPSLSLEDGGIDEQGRWADGVPGWATPSIGLLAAVDVTTGEVINQINQEFSNRSGVLSTSGGLVFTALYDGSVRAYDDETLEELWRFNTGIGIKAPIISFEIDGKQYLAVIAGAPTGNVPDGRESAAGSVLYVFTL